jgi:hypothetical protein
MVGVFGFAVGDVTASGGRVAAGGTNPLVGSGIGVGVGVAAGDGVSGALPDHARGVPMPIGAGASPGPGTVVDESAVARASVPSAVVSTVQEIVTTLVSPSGDTVTYESDPARITEAIPALRTS